MASWSSIRDFYHLHRREVHRYGFVALLVVSALGTGRPGTALLCFLAAPVMYAFDRWGEPLRRQGEELMKRKPRP